MHPTDAKVHLRRYMFHEDKKQQLMLNQFTYLRLHFRLSSTMSVSLQSLGKAGRRICARYGFYTMPMTKFKKTLRIRSTMVVIGSQFQNRNGSLLKGSYYLTSRLAHIGLLFLVDAVLPPCGDPC